MQRTLWMFAVGLLLLGAPAFGEEITKDAVWAADEVQDVTEDLLVASGAVLTIEPGAEVRVGAGVSITVEGTLLARGTEESPISFLPAGDGADPPRWGTLVFTDGAIDATFEEIDEYASGSILEWCEFQGATRALRLTAASPYVHRCLFADNKTAPAFTPPGGGAILIEEGSVARV